MRSASILSYGAPPMAILRIALVTLITILIFLAYRKRYRLPPGPCGLPLLGSLPFLDPQLHRYFASISRTHGPILSLRLGCKLCVVVSSPSTARAVLKDQDLVFANHDVPAVARHNTYSIHDLLWAPYGPTWRTLRKVCVRDLLSHANLEALRPLRRREVRRVVAAVHAQAGEGGAVEVQEVAFLAALNVVMSMLWGVTVDVGGGWGREFLEVMQGIIHMLGEANVSDFFPALEALDLQGLGRKMRRLEKDYKRLWREAVELRERKAGGEAVEKRPFMQVMVELVERGDPQVPLHMDHVGGLLMDLVGGATDTTSTTIEWAMTELLLHPAAMAKAQAELDAVVGTARVVDESDLPNLPFLEAVVKETLRLHPALPLLVPRSPSSSCAVDDYVIPKGSKIFINVWALHRDPSIWDEPEEFRPERFLIEKEGNKGAEKYDYGGNNWNFLPFGGGRRICPGMALGERVVMYMLASLLHSFQWRLPMGEEIDVAEQFGIVLKKAKPLRVIPAARLDKPHLYE